MAARDTYTFPKLPGKWIGQNYRNENFQDTSAIGPVEVYLWLKDYDESREVPFYRNMEPDVLGANGLTRHRRVGDDILKWLRLVEYEFDVDLPTRGESTIEAMERYERSHKPTEELRGRVMNAFEKALKFFFSMFVFEKLDTQTTRARIYATVNSISRLITTQNAIFDAYFAEVGETLSTAFPWKIHVQFYRRILRGMQEMKKFFDLNRSLYVKQKLSFFYGLYGVETRFEGQLFFIHPDGIELLELHNVIPEYSEYKRLLVQGQRPPLSNIEEEPDPVKRMERNQPLTAREIATLPQIPCNDFLKYEDRRQPCPKCLGKMHLRAFITVELPRCEHRFHIDCYREWFGTSGSCPVCGVFVRNNRGAIYPAERCKGTSRRALQPRMVNPPTLREQYAQHRQQQRDIELQRPPRRVPRALSEIRNHNRLGLLEEEDPCAGTSERAQRHQRRYQRRPGT